MDTIKKLIDKLGDKPDAGFSRTKPVKPKEKEAEIYGIIPADRTKPYDVHEVIKRLVDDSEFTEYKALFGKSLICCYARIDGWSVGIVANQRTMVKTKKGEMRFGGVIYSDSADKAARFIMNCNQKNIPLVFLQDVTGFMVGSRSEHGGIIKDGAKMVSAVANSVVPKFTIIMGNSNGAGNYAMCGKAYDPRLIVGWPTAQVAVMGGNQAAKVLMQIEMRKAKNNDQEPDKKVEKEIFEKVKSNYIKQTSPYYAAARLWLDAIIDPLETRKWISMGIEVSNHSPIIKEFNPGIIQT